MHTFLITSINLFSGHLLSRHSLALLLFCKTHDAPHTFISHTNVQINMHKERQFLLSRSALNKTGQRKFRESVFSLYSINLSCCPILNLNGAFPFLHIYSTLVDCFILHAAWWVQISTQLSTMTNIPTV